MKISIIGSRGIPALYGGYETFCEKIFPELQRCGNEVLIIGEKDNFVLHENKLPSKYLNFNKSENPLKYYHKSIKESISWGADKIIMCGVGGVFSAIYYSNKIEFYVNPDGLEFRRAKWSLFKRFFIFVQYLFCALFIENIICDSQGIKTYYSKKFNRKKNLFVAEYGTELDDSSEKTNNKSEFNIPSRLNDYFLIVSRLEPENNVKMMIEGYIESKSEKNLIIVGKLDTEHAQNLIKYKSPRIKFLNGVYEKSHLKALRKHAFAHLHGHSVGGTNPSLLEAMGAANLILAHRNSFNEAILNSDGYYFSSSKELSLIIREIESIKSSILKKKSQNNYFKAKENYTWEIIGVKYNQILENGI